MQKACMHIIIFDTEGSVTETATQIGYLETHDRKESLYCY